MGPPILTIDKKKSEATLLVERSRDVAAGKGQHTMFQKLKQRLKSVVIDGVRLYVAEGDTLLDEDQLYFYSMHRERLERARQQSNMLELAGLGTANLTQPSGNGILGPEPRGLVGILQSGRLVRWDEGVVLTYCVLKRSFGGDEATAHYQLVVDGMKQATRQWQETCGVRFQYRPDRDDAPVGAAPEGVIFPVRELDVGGAFIAAAFFPNDPLERRRVVIDPSYYEPNLTFDKVGVLRHELGHVLGFRHEHIRSQAPPVCQGEDVEGTLDLTQYDPQSVMHYFCGGLGSRELAITELDRVGAQVLYGPPESGGLEATRGGLEMARLFPRPQNLSYVR